MQLLPQMDMSECPVIILFRKQLIFRKWRIDRMCFISRQTAVQHADMECIMDLQQ